jgi:hypothetical protein
VAFWGKRRVLQDFIRCADENEMRAAYRNISLPPGLLRRRIYSFLGSSLSRPI